MGAPWLPMADVDSKITEDVLIPSTAWTRPSRIAELQLVAKYAID
jgi:hypothetical protein